MTATPQWLKWGLIVFLCLALLAGQSWVTYRVFTSRFPGGNDFYARWANGCELIWSGRNPYSDEVTQQTQIGIHGRPAQAGEDIAAFWYPLYTLFFFWPLCFTRFYPLAQAIWMTLMLYALLGALILTARIVDWRPPTWLWAVTLIWGVFNYPHARAVILGQMATVVFLALAASLWALARNQDWLAGALLTATTIKPQMSFLLIPWVLWWAAWRRRWGIWKGFSLAMFLLVSISLVLVPTWIGDFSEDVRTYSDSCFRASASQNDGMKRLESHQDDTDGTNYGSLLRIVTRHFLKLGLVAEAVPVVILTLYLLWMGWQHRQAGWDGFLWMTGLVLILTNFVAPRTATTHYTMLLLPLFVWFVRLSRCLPKHTWLLVFGIEAALLVGQWVIFLTTVRGNYETAPVYLPFPVLMLIVQVLTRQSRSEAPSLGGPALQR